jgi:predicted nucleic acid-binding protein
MPELPTLYLESTVPAHLVSEPSRDLLVAAYQQVTRTWWDNWRIEYDIYISEAVISEVRVGEADEVSRRLALIESFKILGLSAEVEEVVKKYQRHLSLPKDAWLDMVHLAYASVYKMDYLLTWDFKNIANGGVIMRLRKTNQELGISTPIILTPEALIDA